nr:sugar phosphate isomerase/epimerase family protein [Alicyclobacillus cellulosilyticus]
MPRRQTPATRRPLDLNRLSLNQATTEPYTLAEAAAACAQAGIGWFAPWRHKIAATGLAESARILKNYGLRVSSLCRGGMFPAPTRDERAARIEDNRRAIAEAAALETDVLVLVCGPPNGCPLDEARQMVEDGIAALIPYAEQHGVRLAIEPLHPMFAADRSVIVSLGQANDIVQRLGSPWVGVVIDVYHVWWDPYLDREIARARGHIFGFHVNDWVVPMADTVTSRGLMGEGCIDIPRIREAVEAAGYHGPIEVEVMNRDLWQKGCREIVEMVKNAYMLHT